MKQKYPKLDIPSKEELKEIMKTPGEIKGSAFKGDLEYILLKKGEEGLKVVEKETERLGYPIKYREIKEIEWYPMGLRIVSLCAILNTFNWGKKELAELAESSSKASYIIKLFLRFFISPAKIVKLGAPRMWKRYFSVGECKAVDFGESEKGGYTVLRVKNFKLHPFYCSVLGYWFMGVARLIRPDIKEITVEETKCMFRGDPYHDYLIKWTYK